LTGFLNDALIVTPDGQQVLVDGGASPTALMGELGRWMPFNDREIELVVVTHPGDERLSGLLGLAQRYRIGQVVQAPFPYPSAGVEEAGKAQVGAAGWHRTDLEGTVSFVSDGERLFVAE
jgi:metal-dependent hydrolase (beta-lactamase superfamily II)